MVLKFTSAGRLFHTFITRTQKKLLRIPVPFSDFVQFFLLFSVQFSGGERGLIGHHYFQLVCWCLVVRLHSRYSFVACITIFLCVGDSQVPVQHSRYTCITRPNALPVCTYAKSASTFIANGIAPLLIR